MKKRLLIIGSGGHGRVVADAVLHSQEFELIGFADDDSEIGKKVIGKYNIVANLDNQKELKMIADYFVVAIGNNEIRKKIFGSLSRFMKAATVIHPFSSISPFAKIGDGTMVLAGSVISANAVVGENCIVNVQSLVDHDSIIGSHSHISRGAMVGSHCTLPENFMLDSGEYFK